MNAAHDSDGYGDGHSPLEPGLHGDGPEVIVEWHDGCGDGAHDHGETAAVEPWGPRPTAAAAPFLPQGGAIGAGAAEAPTVTESEPNDTAAAAANPVGAVSATPTVVGGSIDGGGDVDFFRFTVSQRSGVYFDLEATEVGSTLDAIVGVFGTSGASDPATLLAENDEGWDFTDFSLSDAAQTEIPHDSALYLDLDPGTYDLRVRSYNNTAGAYRLKVHADGTYTSAVPALESLPGAADTLYLDFDGHASGPGGDHWGVYTIPAFDQNSNPGEWTPGERATIYNVWRSVAEDYAPFNINVTTSYGGAFDDGVAFRQVIGNSDGSQVGYPGVLGVANRQSYVAGGASNNLAFTFAGNFWDDAYQGDDGSSSRIMTRAIEMANTSSHEFGHALGLRHYATDASLGNTRPNALMASPDFGLSRERWGSGPTKSDEPPAVPLQDDAAVIAGPVNTLGYRPDDHGDLAVLATELASDDGSAYSGEGVIVQTTDADVFRFAGSGETTVRASVVTHVANLDLELRLYDAAGTLVAADDPGAAGGFAGENALGGALSVTLAAGTYYVEVRSDGGPGEIGQYGLSIRTAPDVPPPATVAGRHLFYNNSAYDTPTQANPDLNDGTAVAADKAALLPGQTAGPANSAGYSRGVNGVMVDLSGLTPQRTPTPADFTFKAGDTADPAGWADAPAPAVMVDRGAGTNGSDRVVMTWPDGAIRNTWLQVTVRATPDTGLAAPDVFYFGSLIGDADGSGGVNLGDFGTVRQDFGRTGLSVAAGRSDFNRDGTVNLADFGILRANFGRSLPAPAVSTQAPPAAAVASDPAPLAPALPDKRRARATAGRPSDDLASVGLGG